MIDWYETDFAPLPGMERDALEGNPSPITCDDAGRLCGYVARTGQEVPDLPFRFKVPVEPDFREYAMPSTVSVLDEGYEPIWQSVGMLSWKDGHPSADITPEEAVAHYNDPQRAIAAVAYGQDRFGIWCAGRLLDPTPGNVLRVNVQPVSGDWRVRNGKWRFLGACLVNVPRLSIREGMRVAASLDQEWVCAIDDLNCGCAPVSEVRSRFDETVRTVAASLFGGMLDTDR